MIWAGLDARVGFELLSSGTGVGFDGDVLPNVSVDAVVDGGPTEFLSQMEASLPGPGFDGFTNIDGSETGGILDVSGGDGDFEGCDALASLIAEHFGNGCLGTAHGCSDLGDVRFRVGRGALGIDGFDMDNGVGADRSHQLDGQPDFGGLVTGEVGVDPDQEGQCQGCSNELYLQFHGKVVPADEVFWSVFGSAGDGIVNR